MVRVLRGHDGDDRLLTGSPRTVTTQSRAGGTVAASVVKMNTTLLLKALNAGRVLVGLGLTIAPEKVGGQWFGPDAGRPATKVAIRALGIRDLAVGAATLGALQSTGIEGTGTKILAGLGVLCDAVDAAASAAAGDSLPKRGRPTVAIATAAAAMGAIALAGATSSD